MTNLEKLEKDIRQKLPRLMEVKIGVNYQFKLMDGTMSRVIKCTNIRKHLSQDTEDSLFSYNDSGLVNINNAVIIGHDPMLNDVLEWLSLRNYHMGIATDGCILYFSMPSGYESVNEKMLWSLSSPYLKDQPQELIDYLASLI